LSFSILIVMFAVNNLGSGDLLRSVLNWSVLGLLILGVLLFTGLILLEKRNEAREVDAILPYRVLRKQSYSATTIIAFLSGTFIGSIIFIHSFVEMVLGISDS